MRILVVAAHPDDEVLGCGGTMARHAADGDEVHVLFLADGVTARRDLADPDAERERRAEAACRAAAILGAQPPRLLDFADNRLDEGPLLDVVQAVEAVAAEIGPEMVYTHHGGDLNADHRIAHQAVMTACRPLPGRKERTILAFETVSSTEWASRWFGEAFRPNRYVDVTGYLDKKLAALACYDAEIRPFPHPRSPENLRALARVRGAESGLENAEAFVSLREIVA